MGVRGLIDCTRSFDAKVNEATKGGHRTVQEERWGGGAVHRILRQLHAKRNHASDRFASANHPSFMTDNRSARV